MSAVGLAVATVSFLFALYVLIGKLTDWYLIDQPPGWATIVVLISFLMGLMMIMLGVVGEYLWRILEASRRRPFYLIDEVSDDEK
jgi:dolichol-phosphate mannosyltransferase